MCDKSQTKGIELFVACVGKAIFTKKAFRVNCSDDPVVRLLGIEYQGVMRMHTLLYL